MIIGWNGETVPALPLERELQVIAGAGYGGVELFVPKLAAYLREHTPADLAGHLAAHGLLPLAMNGVENVNLQPALEFARVKSECRWLAEVSQAIGCPTIVIVPSPRPGRMPWSEIVRQTSAAVRELADLVAPHGVRLAFEFLAPASCSVRTLAQAWEIVRAVERNNVGLVLDTYHFHVGGSSPASLAEFDIARLFIVHINDIEDLPLAQLTDGDRLLPGEGVLPLGAILSPLAARGYAGAYSLEVMRPAYRERESSEYAAAGFHAVRSVLCAAGAA